MIKKMLTFLHWKLGSWKEASSPLWSWKRKKSQPFFPCLRPPYFTLEPDAHPTKHTSFKSMSALFGVMCWPQLEVILRSFSDGYGAAGRGSRQQTSSGCPCGSDCGGKPPAVYEEQANMCSIRSKARHASCYLTHWCIYLIWVKSTAVWYGVPWGSI